MGRIIAIVSGKGGSGKTSFAINIGAAMASRGSSTVLLDMNVGTRNLDIYMGLENKVLFDLGDVLTGVCDLEKALVRDERFRMLSLLSCPQYKMINGLTPQHVRTVCAKLVELFEYVIIDCPSGLGSEFINAVSAADTALLIVTPDHTSIRNCDVIDRRLASLGITNRFYAVNRYDLNLSGNGLLPDINYIGRMFTIPLAGTIPEDPNIHVGNNSGYPIVCNADAPVSMAFMNIARKLMD